MNEVKIFFDNPIPFETENLKILDGITGLYFIFSNEIEIQYPFSKSKLLYIGMSEMKTNSIKKRLSGHFDGKSKNIGLQNYRKVTPLLFTYINFEVLRDLWNLRIEDLENYFIADFVKNFGVYPICNNKLAMEITKISLPVSFVIDWKYF